MKYIKKFNKINESSKEELDYETFQDIMFEVTDGYGDFKFEDWTDENEKSYICVLSCFPIYRDSELYLNSDYLNNEEFNLDFSSKMIDGNNKHTESFKKSIENFIENNNRLQNTIIQLKEHTIPRLETYKIEEIAYSFSDGELMIHLEYI